MKSNKTIDLVLLLVISIFAAATSLLLKANFLFPLSFFLVFRHFLFLLKIKSRKEVSCVCFFNYGPFYFSV